MIHVIDNAPINYESTEIVVKKRKQNIMLRQYSLSSAHYGYEREKKLTSRSALM